ncbi:lysozyme [Quadrisphaera granulorum]|uniref:Lysozyme n=1 Tax=Quadrisphaera granulorum TaxID=317664 RepID=A0A315ZNW7_9ACTN|nr:GH25 family lysozyme [Quadrisphaera granulorum]PWJ46969.1 lysozyme [Quadrisphaera granulorum]SZE98965.1 lysozyme [Quadrisphaera granulorum]
MITRARRRRWWTAVTAVVVALVALGTAAALWVPHHRPALRAGEAYGIDVSNHQGTIDWAAVASDDVAFAYIKSSEGGDFTDDRFTENWAAAERVGVQRGAYHFFTLCRPGAEQAAHFLRTVPPEASALPPAVDLELAGNCAARPTREAVDAELDTFLTAVEAAWGRRVVPYVGEDWEGAYPVVDRRDLPERPQWLVSFVGRPNQRWTVWQYAWWGAVDGVEGRVDLDVARLGELTPSR